MPDSYIVPARAYEAGQMGDFDALVPRRPEGMIDPYILVLVSTDISQTTHVYQGEHQLQFTNNELDFTFDVPFDDDPSPNECEFVVYNLNQSSRSQIAVGDILSITFGYNGDMGVIFVGFISEVESNWVDGSMETVIRANSTGAFQEDIEATYEAGMTASFILEDLCNRSVLSIAAFETEADRTFEEAVTVEGNLGEAIAEYAAMCGVQARIVRQELYVQNMYKEPADKIILNETTGLFGSPSEFQDEERDQSIEKEDGDPDQMIVYTGRKITGLLNHRLVPGAGVVLQSRNVESMSCVVREGRHKFNGVSATTEATLVEYGAITTREAS